MRERRWREWVSEREREKRETLHGNLHIKSMSGHHNMEKVTRRSSHHLNVLIVFTYVQPVFVPLALCP